VLDDEAQTVRRIQVLVDTDSSASSIQGDEIKRYRRMNEASRAP